MKILHERKATLIGQSSIGYITFRDDEGEIHHLRRHQVEKELAQIADVGIRVVLQYKTDTRSGLWYATGPAE